MKKCLFNLLTAVLICGSVTAQSPDGAFKVVASQYGHEELKNVTEKPGSKDVLKNNALEGVWYLKTAEWGTATFGKGEYKDVTAVKIYAFPRFAFAYYNEKTQKFVGAGGGTYQFDGKTLSEKIEYWSWGTPKFPLSVFAINFSNNQYTQEGWEKGLRETWEKSK